MKKNGLKKSYSEKCMSDLDEEVSNILGQEYMPLGFRYFEEK